MSSKIVNEDLRSIKTKKALYGAMFTLLKNLSFRKITIKEICEEALVSRATFYAHFIDKYDLLEHWLPKVSPKELSCNDAYEEIERAVNGYFNENMAVLKNLVQEADEETIGILSGFFLSTIEGQSEKSSENPNHIVFSNFYAGGIISYLKWQVSNRFPPAVPLMNKDLYEMIRALQEWQTK